MALDTTLRIARPDDFYARLMAAHDGLEDARSAALNARLILLMANRIGDDAVLDELLDAASEPA